MRIAIASGKGGTGKTTLSVNLAQVAPCLVTLLDCDVEEPNAHLFLPLSHETNTPVTLPVPRIDAQQCDGCGKCSEFCAYVAIIMVGNRPLLFPELCHSCGGCAKVCPNHAIDEVEQRIGCVTSAGAGHVTVVTGRLDVGVALAPPLIRAVLAQVEGDPLTLIDAPPGSACPMVTAVRDADFVVLVTEPTPFGLHDLTLAVAVLEELSLHHGVVINRASGDDRVREFCRAKGIPVLLELPEDRRIAEACSCGEPLIDALPEYRTAFAGLLAHLRDLAAATTHA